MYRQILIPTEKDHNIELPSNLYGKRIEVIAIELSEDKELKHHIGRKNFLDDIDIISDFPSIDEIRKESWPSKW